MAYVERTDEEIVKAMRETVEGSTTPSGEFRGPEGKTYTPASFVKYIEENVVERKKFCDFARGICKSLGQDPIVFFKEGLK